MRPPKLTSLVFGAAFLLSATQAVRAQRATQTVMFRVDAINEVAVQGTPTLTMVTSVAGDRPTSVTASGSTWSVTTNENNARITASLAADMPPGLTLSISLGAPAGAMSKGLQVLGTAPVEVITNLSRVAASGLPLSYQLDATPKAGIVAAGTRTVIFTITGGM